MLLTALAATVAPAGAIYTTSVDSTFAIGPGTVSAGPVLTSSFSTGAGFAGFGGSLSPSGAKPAVISSGVTGTAPFAVSSASSTYQASHIITLDNSAGLTPMMAAFTFSYGWTVTLSADVDPFDFATAGAFFHITGIDNETLTIAGVPVAEYLVHPVYTTAAGGTGGAGGGMVTGSIIVPSGAISTFSVITDTHGYAQSVPEPSTAVMLAFAAAVTCLRARR
jgi:hypothetical protein